MQGKCDIIYNLNKLLFFVTWLGGPKYLLSCPYLFKDTRLIVYFPIRHWPFQGKEAAFIFFTTTSWRRKQITFFVLLRSFIGNSTPSFVKRIFYTAQQDCGIDDFNRETTYSCRSSFCTKKMLGDVQSIWLPAGLLLPITESWQLEIWSHHVRHIVSPETILHYRIPDEDQGMRQTWECLLCLLFQGHIG